MKNEYGETALYGLIEHQSFYETDKNTTKKLKILLSLGADMFATNNDGVTIFDSIERRTTEDPNIRLILRTLALRKIAGLQPSIELKYERLMEQEDPNLWEYFQKCIEEINRMKSTNVFKSCSVFEILTKCQCELELHMRYNEFRRRFRLVNLSIFHVYVDDINEAFERAERYYNCVLDQENLINEALYNFFPEMFVRKGLVT
ncbi:uncharacterized protein LOC103316240 [Nasonia vitripennis]|uniref:Uncharacterized protein n=1 Tax=Nasonia vitripennis TaxID=7425 RepID=A0A7M7HAR7_NASVI|nr:uncharacterized protein LOC103316240 [Nasonia vitripennis]